MRISLIFKGFICVALFIEHYSEPLARGKMQENQLLSEHSNENVSNLLMIENSGTKTHATGDNITDSTSQNTTMASTGPIRRKGTAWVWLILGIVIVSVALVAGIAMRKVHPSLREDDGYDY